MTSLNVQFTPRSKNAKTGPIPVTMSGAQGCPSDCPFNHANRGGCYAAHGPISWNWRKVTNGERGGDWEQLCRNVEALPEGQLWRHNQAGDLPHVNGYLDHAALQDLVDANQGRRGFTYTHHNPELGDNGDWIEWANWKGFTINLSADNLKHADKLAALNIAPVVVVLPQDTTANTTTPEGRKVVVCPATQREDVTCASCQLCHHSRMHYRKGAQRPIVGFPAHGSAKRKATAIAVG